MCPIQRRAKAFTQHYSSIYGLIKITWKLFAFCVHTGNEYKWSSVAARCGLRRGPLTIHIKMQMDISIFQSFLGKFRFQITHVFFSNIIFGISLLYRFQRDVKYISANIDRKERVRAAAGMNTIYSTKNFTSLFIEYCVGLLSVCFACILNWELKMDWNVGMESGIIELINGPVFRRNARNVVCVREAKSRRVHK